MPFAVVEPGLHGHDLAARDDGRVHLAKRHPQQVENADAGAGRDRLNPQPKVAGEDREERQANNQHKHDADQHHRAAFKQPLGKQSGGESHWYLHGSCLWRANKSRIALSVSTPYSYILCNHSKTEFQVEPPAASARDCENTMDSYPLNIVSFSGLSPIWQRDSLPTAHSPAGSTRSRQFFPTLQMRSPAPQRPLPPRTPAANTDDERDNQFPAQLRGRLAASAVRFARSVRPCCGSPRAKSRDHRRGMLELLLQPRLGLVSRMALRIVPHHQRIAQHHGHEIQIVPRHLAQTKPRRLKNELGHRRCAANGPKCNRHPKYFPAIVAIGGRTAPIALR